MSLCSIIILGDNRVAALFHQPLRCAGGTADADGVHTLKPFLLYLLRPLDEVTVGVDALTFVEEHLTVTALAPAHEEHKVVTTGECRNVRHSVGHLTADGVETLECGIRRYMFLYIFNDTMKFVERLSRLRVEIDIPRKIKTLHLLNICNHDSLAFRLPHKT